MKRLMSSVMVLVAGMFVTTACAMAADQDNKGPVGVITSATVDTTKKVGAVAGDTIGVISGAASEATEDITGVTGETTENVGAVAGDTIGVVSDATVEVARTVTGTTGDVVEAVSGAVDEATSDDIK